MNKDLGEEFDKEMYEKYGQYGADIDEKYGNELMDFDENMNPVDYGDENAYGFTG